MRRKPLILFTSLALAMAILVASDNLSPVSATSCAPESSKVIDGETEYTILQFKTGDCTWQVPLGVASLHYLIVAGGGGGGSRHGGGGGAGGVVTNLGSTPLSVTPGASGEIKVGSGGPGASAGNSTFGSKGQDSSAFFTGEVAKGGGGGTSTSSFNSLQNGGSGGGGRGNTKNDGGKATPGQGNDGGSTDTGGKMLGGGGGGYSQAGATGGDDTGNGGSGFNASSLLGTQFGVDGWFAGGGGGGAENHFGAAGLGGGGKGGFTETGDDAATAGVANTGGGGGGGGHTGGTNYAGKAGGSGIVIVRYITPPAITNTNGIVMLVDPRSESVAIPYLTLATSTATRVCFDLTTSSNSQKPLKSFVNKNTDSDDFRMAVTFEDVTVGVGVENALSKITSSRANAQALLKRNAPNSESYLRLHRPASGWSEVDGGKMKVRVDYATNSDCSVADGSEINVEIPIKVLEIAAIQKNPVDLTRG